MKDSFEDLDPYERIVTLWLEGRTMQEIGKILRMSPTNVAVRIHRMRQAGVKLPPRKRRGVSINPSKLNALIKKHSTKKGA